MRRADAEGARDLRRPDVMGDVALELARGKAEIAELRRDGVRGVIAHNEHARTNVAFDDPWRFGL